MTSDITFKIIIICIFVIMRAETKSRPRNEYLTRL